MGCYGNRNGGLGLLIGVEGGAYACHMPHGLSLHNNAIAEKQNLGLRSTVFIRLTALGAY